MRILRSRAAVTVVVGAFILGGCGGGGSTSLPASVAPTVAAPSVAAAPQSLHHKHRRHPRDASVCTTMPVNGLQVTTTSMTLAPNASGQFTACTQYASKYTITVSPSGILTAPVSGSSVTPKVQPTTIKTASITVTAGATCGSATITVTDKKRKSASVNVSVTGCSQAFNFTAPGGQQTFTVPAGVTQITIDAVGASGGIQCGGSGSGGSGFELKASGIPVTGGQTLYVYVGGTPVGTSPPVSSTCNFAYSSGGFNGGGTAQTCPKGCAGGGGGGGSDVRTSLSDLTTRLIVAGGGGGAGDAQGGAGGYSSGAPGSYSYTGQDPTSVVAGQGGTQALGGAAGQLPNTAGATATCNPGQASLGQGGSQLANSVNGEYCAAGAGGGGYYGGGAGTEYYILASESSGTAAGGGGSSFVVNGATVVTQQVATPGQCDTSNNGCITISW